jgi:hypothetical protein
MERVVIGERGGQARSTWIGSIAYFGQEIVWVGRSQTLSYALLPTY